MTLYDFFIQTQTSTLLKDISIYGVIPVLTLAVTVLWKKVSSHEKTIQKLNDEHKSDIRNNADELKGLQQNTVQQISTLNVQLPNFVNELKKVSDTLTKIVAKL